MEKRALSPYFLVKLPRGPRYDQCRELVPQIREKYNRERYERKNSRVLTYKRPEVRFERETSFVDTSSARASRFHYGSSSAVSLKHRA